jgi:hypothetical protein
VIVVGYVGSLWLAPLVWGQSLPSLDAALILGGWLTVLVVAAEVVRMRRERVAESRAARRVEERRRVTEDRLRMACDLDDVIGHNISLINVQATMGLDLIDADPARARAALAAIKTVSKDALGELRAMLAALRQDEIDAPRQPAPGLDRLDELVEATRAAGLPVVTEVVCWCRSPKRRRPTFQFEIARQFTVAGYDDEHADDSLWALRLTFHYPATDDAFALGSGDQWCDDPDGTNELRSYIEATAATSYTRRIEAARIELMLDPAG